MSLSSSFDSMFKDDPFFSQGSLLQPLHQRALSAVSGLQQDFLTRRTNMAHSLLKELSDGLPGDLFPERPLQGPPSLRLAPGAPTPSEDPSGQLAEAGPSQAPRDLSMSLGAHGFRPEDITVKLEGRRLAVVAMKQAQAEEVQSSSSATSCSSFSSSSSQQKGFSRRFNLPAHLDLTALSCKLGADGNLYITAPAAQQPISEEDHEAPAAQQPISEEDHEAPARFRTSLDIPITQGNAEEAGAGQETNTA